MTQVHAGRLQHHYDCWLKVTKNPVVLDWIHNGYCIPISCNVVQNYPPHNTFSIKEKQEMPSAISNLIDLGAVTKCNPQRDQFVSNIFLAPKSNGGHRFILNLKQLNKLVSNSHFKMEDHRTASKMIPNQGFMATIDLKESYLLVPINTSHRKYLRFQFEDINSQVLTYEFNAMPYGLSSAPRTFTKIMKEVVSHLRYRGFKSVIYLDDILCIGDSFDDCLRNVTETLRLLNCLGFIVNNDKSCLHPQQCCKFLGFMYNSVDMTISLPLQKRNNI